MLLEQNRRERQTLSLPSPLWGRVASEASRVGVVRLRASIASDNDPHPNPSPQGGGEQTERTALFCVKSKGAHFNSRRARRDGTVSTWAINHAA
jgi:hypothetical protein